MGSNSTDFKEMKQAVKNHWEAEVCGTRFTDQHESLKSHFEEIEDTRYTHEDYIKEFAQFEQGRGKKVLEIGVGAGTDFQNWVKNGAMATGIDMTEAAIAKTSKRLAFLKESNFEYTLKQDDAENLSFQDNTFDIVYSHGVLHHTPDTVKAIKETFRVLSPGGTVKLMVYGNPSWVGFMLWARYALMNGKFSKSLKQVVFENLESPGTKVYSNNEFKKLMEKIGYTQVVCARKLSSGDLMAMPLSNKFKNPVYKIIVFLYPSKIIRMFGEKLGTALICTATKPKA